MPWIYAHLLCQRSEAASCGTRQPSKISSSGELVRPNKPSFQRVRVPPAQIAQSATQSYLTLGGGDSPGESSRDRE